MKKNKNVLTKQLDDSLKRSILHRRAEVLAREVKQQDCRETIEFTEFMISSERYGIENTYIREVYPLKEFTALPGTPAHVFGIINVRGKILSIIDIRKLFDLPSKGLSDYNKIIIIHKETMVFGILADSIVGVQRYPTQELIDTLPTLTDIRLDYLKGVTRDCLVVLDGEKLLNSPKIIVHDAY
jgi:purine-binding chemotaxis protein CheW